jgi:Zn-dependent protease with chaperone function
MIGAAALVAYAVLLLTAGVPALARSRWPDRAPRLAVFAWLAVTGTAAASIALSGLMLVVPEVRIAATVVRLADGCAAAVRAQYLHPGGKVLAAAGSLLAIAVLGRVLWCSAHTLTLARLARRRHRRSLAMAGRFDHRLGAVIVDHDEPAAWCLPGPGKPVVLSRAAVDALDPGQLAAVLAHERAHQQGRHHIIVAVADSLSAAFPRVAAFRTSHAHVAWLVELLADDAAAAACSPLTVAEAILALGTSSHTPAVLHAGGRLTVARVHRLISAPLALRRSVAFAGMLAIAVLTAFPLLVLIGPAVAMAGQARCPMPGQHATSVSRHVTSRTRSAAARLR